MTKMVFGGFAIVLMGIGAYHFVPQDQRFTSDSGMAALSIAVESNDNKNNDPRLLPDLVPLPADDLTLEDREDQLLLQFSTTYINQGSGPLELRADERTRGIREDTLRNVYQRIYLPTGGYEDHLSGEFLWHESHLHYHFADFVTYDLSAVDFPEPPDLSGVRSKATFCVRDVSKVHMELEHRAAEAMYRICGKELQGISVGWGDTYFYDYPDQHLNVTGLPQGTYRLSFHVNPDSRFKESDHENNTSSVLFRLYPEEKKIELIEEQSTAHPEIEHVYEEQEFD